MQQSGWVDPNPTVKDSAALRRELAQKSLVLLDDKCDYQNHSPFCDAAVFYDDLGILDPSSFDAFHGFTRLRDSAGYSIFNSFGGAGDNFDNFCNCHRIVL